jgi:chromosome segregation ATPase
MAHEATAGLTRQVVDNEQLLALLTQEEGVSSRLRAELERLKRELADQQATLTARGSASDSWQRERLTLEGRLREAESATGAARADRERLAAQLRDLELKLAAKDGEAGQATDDLERKLREAEAAVRTLQGEREQSERRQRSLEAEREHDRERARHEKESLEGRLREAERQAAKLSADKAEAERRLREALQHSQSMESRVTSLTRENLLLSADFEVCARCPLPCAASDGLGSWLFNYARATR